MRKIIISLIPNSLKKSIREYIRKRTLMKITSRQNEIYLKYSSTYNTLSLNKIESLIAMGCHRIEKGLTMKDMRYGFGSDLIMNIIDLCYKYINLGYSLERIQIRHVISVLLEYKLIHKQSNFELDNSIIEHIDNLSKIVNIYSPQTQYKFTQESYFANINSSFDKFSMSRHSVRNYHGEVDLEDIKKALDLAKYAPSSCNRQSTRVYVIQNKELIKSVLSFQVGNRGFGDLSDKLIVLTSEVSVYNDVKECNSPYVDGGIYGMNLLYSLHFYKIAACTLNCYLDLDTEKELRKLLNIPESEVFIFILTLGRVPKEFKVGVSARNNIIDNIKII